MSYRESTTIHSRLALVALFLLVAVCGRAMAFGDIASRWQALYESPTGPCGFASQAMQNILNATESRCQFCHQSTRGGAPWNAYGFEVRSNGQNFAAAENLNSDGDSGGASNLDEICANAQPGWNADETNVVFDRTGATAAATAPTGVLLDAERVSGLPVSNAGPDQVVGVGDNVTLDGSGSEGPDGDALTYVWTLTAPGDSGASLVDANTASPSFVADVEGTYTAALVVSDGENDSAQDTVSIEAATTPENRLPVSDAGPDQTVPPGSTVTLDGSGSSDADGDTLTYAWTLSAPADSTATLSDASAEMPTFVADLAGSYTAQLIVNDGSGDSAPDDAVISAEDLITIDDPIPGSIAPTRYRVSLETVASGLVAPNWGTAAPGLDDYLFVTDQPGSVQAINLATGATSNFADVSGLLGGLLPNGGLGARDFLPFDERGLLGIAFHPDYASNGLLYTYTSEAATATADFPIEANLTEEQQAQFDASGVTYPNHQAVIREWTASDPGDPSAGVNTESRVVLRVDQPQFNHNGGGIAFDNAGMLLIALGDGGAADDSPEADGQEFLAVPILGHGQVGNGQNPATILGSILRIDPRGTSSRNGQYGVPDDNPFARPDEASGGQAGCADGSCDEIFAYGFRNPFRMSVDTATGLVFTGDVGQNDIEEIDIVVSGGNYGWKLKEGTFLFDPNGANAGLVVKDSPEQPLGMVDPIAQYDHDEGVSAIGGFVYRGESVVPLSERYVFGEYTRPPFDAGNVVCAGRLFTTRRRFREDQARRTEIRVLKNAFEEAPNEAFLELQLTAPLNACVLGFAQDAAGEVYVLANTTGIPAGDTGVVLRIAPR